MKNTIIGIDVSCKTLDICVKSNDLIQHYIIDNEVKSIKKFLKTYDYENVMIAMENTGRYNWNLYQVLEPLNHQVYVIAPLHMKRSMGLVRGKNDKIDAVRICDFIEKHHLTTVQWKPVPVAIKKLKVLLTERVSRVKMKRKLLKQQHDYSLMKSMGLDKELSKLNKKLIMNLDKQIAAIEKMIENIISQDSKLAVQKELIQSVPGVGKILAWTMLAKTQGFTTITNPREMACFSGIVPFDHQSGSSINRKPRVSIYGDKTVKNILHLAAMSAIRLDNDLAVYYQRKVAEGKNKMSVLNAVRNKIVHRIFAVIKNQTMYKNRLVLS